MRIFCNLFLDEYKETFFSTEDPILEELFIINNIKFSKVNNEGVDKFPKEIYTGILKTILDLDLTYEKIFHKKTIEEGDKSIGNIII